MKRVFTIFIYICLVGLTGLQTTSSYAAEKADSANLPAESRMVLNYLCGPDTVILTATLSVKRGETTLALEKAQVDFIASAGALTVALGNAKTDQEGNAVYKVPVTTLPAGKDGMVSYAAKFTGNDKYPAAEASFMAKPAKIRLFFSIEDSIRVLKVTATQKNEKGEEVVIPKETVLVYIPRLFSLLKIGEVALDESGMGTLEFPKEIVGDTLGNLVVMARIEEHDQFGYVQGQNVINWGVHKQYYKAEVPSRELWTPIAPLWMIITLLIMLAGVWAHYIYAVYELVMIKRLSKKDKPFF
jgi:hypothetical protein